MRGDAASMQVHVAKNATDACRFLRKNPEARPLAGGTDLFVLWNLGLLNDESVLDLSRIASWRQVRQSSRGIDLGALATFTRLRTHPLVTKKLPLLAAAAGTVGGLQIQNRATLAGNIANASPAGDSFPPLAVYDARVRVISHDGSREMGFLETFAGVKQTNLKAGELIRSVHIPTPVRPTRRMFRKVGTRAAQAISKVVAAGQLWCRRDGTVRELRFALGSVAPTVVRLATVESEVQDHRLTPQWIARAVDAVDADISPIDDIRSTREYRRQVARNLVRDFLQG